MAANSGNWDKNLDGSTEAFIMEDFTFFDKNRKKYDGDFINMVDEVEYVDICWRCQKNNQNGQKITYARNNKNILMCPVQAAINIVKRANRLKIGENTPLAVFVHITPKGKKSLQCVTDSQVVVALQEAAKKVYGLTKYQEIKRFTCHSIRVGACVLLHTQGTPDTVIKLRLRWRSNYFLDYLRNMPDLAVMHSNNVASKEK